jgi:hypothetical protein
MKMGHANYCHDRARFFCLTEKFPACRPEKVYDFGRRRVRIGGGWNLLCTSNTKVHMVFNHLYR